MMEVILWVGGNVKIKKGYNTVYKPYPIGIRLIY